MSLNASLASGQKSIRFFPIHSKSLPRSWRAHSGILFASGVIALEFSPEILLGYVHGIVWFNWWKELNISIIEIHPYHSKEMGYFSSRISANVYHQNMPQELHSIISRRTMTVNESIGDCLKKTIILKT